MRARITSLWTLLLILLPLLVTGCASLGPRGPERAGQAITFGYLLAESKLSDDQREAVKAVWLAFDATIRATETRDAAEIKAAVSGVVAAQFDGDVQTFALLFLNQAFDRLVGAVDWDSLTADQRWQQLQQFHEAITDTLKLYSGGTGDDSADGTFRHRERAVGTNQGLDLRLGGPRAAARVAWLPERRGLDPARVVAVCRATPGRQDVPGSAGARRTVCRAPRDARDGRPYLLALAARYGRRAGKGWCVLACGSRCGLARLAREDARAHHDGAPGRVALC